MPSIAASTLDRAALYRLLTGLVVPRPIGWVSTIGADGTPNLAPFSFFTVVGALPPLVGFSINTSSVRGPKDTFVNISATGEFVVNFVDDATFAAMDASSEEFPPDVDEFEAVGIAAATDNLFVRSPRVADSPAQLECRHVRTVDFGEYSFVVGEVQAIHLREGLCDSRLRVDFAAYRWVGRLTGGSYVRATPGCAAPEPPPMDGR